MANKLAHFDYSPILVLLNQYASSVTLDQRQQELVQAAQADLHRLNFLSKSIVDTTNAVFALIPYSSPEQWIEVLQSARKDHPDLDAWLTANPEPTMVQSARTAGRPSDLPVENTQKGQHEMRLEIDTRAFYGVAHNLIDTLRKLPRLENCECRPIDEVRNRLIEHRPGQPVVWETFQYSDTVGPQIKAYRRSDQVHISPRDAGFVPNSRALIQDLTVVLQQALSEPAETRNHPLG